MEVDSDDYESDGICEDEYELEDEKECGPRTSKLTPQLKGLMGEANWRISKGELDTAEQICLEVIRQQQQSWEPYVTLAEIYESKDRTKSNGYLTIASYLNPSNSLIWCRLAKMAIEDGNKKEALTYYTKCLINDKKNIEIHYKRLELAKELGNERLVQRFEESLISSLPVDQHEQIIEIASKITKMYHNDKKYSKALSVLQIPFKRIPHCITLHHLNMMLELLLLNGKYVQCLDVFVDHCNFNFEIVVEVDETISINDYSIPEGTSIDLKTKFVICAIKLNCINVANQIIDKILEEEDVEVVGDLFLDICEALIASKKYEIALKLFIPLKKSKNYSLAAVWLKYSECLAAVGLKEQAVEGFYNVITLAPHHIEVLHPLAELLLEMNKEKEALEVMAHRSTDRLNVGVLISRIKLLKQLGHYDELWSCMELLLSRHCIVFRNVTEIKQVLSTGRVADKIQRVQKIREYTNDTSKLIPNADTVCVMEPEPEEELKFLKEYLQFAKDIKDYAIMEKLAIMALTSKKFEKYFEEISHYAVIACLNNNDQYHGYYLVRDFVNKYPGNKYFWNLFSLFSTQSDARMHKFIFRLHQRPKEIEAAELLAANSDFYFGNYHSAMKYYQKEFQLTKSPYLSFLLGIIMMHLGTIKKRTPPEEKLRLTEQATYLFLFYQRNRSKMAEQEIYYNMGRLYHQLGIIYLAANYYEKVFTVKNELLDKHPNILCLKYEAAYNLHLTCLKTNKTMPRQILHKYLTI